MSDKNQRWTKARLEAFRKALSIHAGKPLSSWILQTAFTVAETPSGLVFDTIVPSYLSGVFKGSNSVSAYYGQLIQTQGGVFILPKLTENGTIPQAKVDPVEGQTAGGVKAAFVAGCRAAILRGATCADLTRWVQEVRDHKVVVKETTVERRAAFKPAVEPRPPSVALLGFLPRQYSAICEHFRSAKLNFKDHGIGDLTIMTGNHDQSYTYVKSMCSRGNKKFVFNNVGGLSLATSSIQGFIDSQTKPD